MLRLASGTGVAQAIGILAAPILTRLYAPEAFGLVTIFASLVLIIGVLACLRYELAIVLPEDDSEAANLFAVCLASSVVIALFTVVLVLLFGSRFLAWIGIPQLGPFLWALPIAVLLHGVFSSLDYWNTRTKHFARLSTVRVTNQAIVTSTNLGAGIAGFATGGVMIAANILGRAGAVALLGYRIARENGRFLAASIRGRKMLAGLRRYRKFPLYSSWSALLNAISWQLPTLMLGAFFSSTVVGFYALGVRIIQMPMNLIGSAVSQVFIQRAAAAKADGTLAELVEALFERLAMASLLPVVVLAVIGRDLYIVLFGSEWAEAGVYTQILSIWAFFWFISSPLSQLFNVLERQESMLIIHIAIFLTRLLSLGVGGYFQNVYLALSLYAGTGVLVYGYLSLRIAQYAGVSFKASIVLLARCFGLFVPTVAITLLAIIALDAPRFALLSVAALALATHGLVMFKRLS